MGYGFLLIVLFSRNVITCRVVVVVHCVSASEKMPLKSSKIGIISF